MNNCIFCSFVQKGRCGAMRRKINSEELYQAALEIFSRYGYRKTTVEDIASALGMTKGNLYLYVESKRDLYEKTVRHALERWQEGVRQAVERETDPGERFTILCRMALRHLSEDDAFRRLLVQDPDIFPPLPAEDPYADINERSVRMIRDVLARGIEAGRFRKVDVTRVAELIFMIYKMLIFRTYIRADEAFVQEMLEDVLDLFTHGLHAGGTPPAGS